jgi:hypothetical protein
MYIFFFPLNLIFLVSTLHLRCGPKRRMVHIAEHPPRVARVRRVDRALVLPSLVELNK